MNALLERKPQLYRLIGVTSVTVAIGVLIAIHLPRDITVNYAAVYALFLLTVASGVVLLLNPGWLVSRSYLFWPIMAGVFPLFESLAVYFTDGFRSPMFVLFYFSLFFVGMLGGQRGAVAGAVLCGLFYVAAGVAQSGSLRSELALRLMVIIGSFYGVAWFAAYLGNIASQESRDASRRALRIAGLNAVNTNLSETLEYDVLVQQVPEELCRQLGFERALLYLVSGNKLCLTAAHSNDDPVRLARLTEYMEKHAPGLDSNSVEAEAARTLRPLVSADPSCDPRVNPRVLEIAQSQCFAAAPLVAKEELIGVIVADYFREQHSITEEEVILLHTFASLAALALSNSRLVAEAGRAEAYRQLDTLKSEFLATVSHELRTPLTLIKTSTDLLLDDVSDGLTGVQRRLTETVNRNTARLSAFVEEILEMAQLEEGQVQLHKQLTDLRYLVDEVAQTMQLMVQHKEQTLYLDLADEACLVEVDRHRMQQVITNLLGNALKYTPAEGKVWLRVLPEGEWVSVEVRDNGPGVPSDKLERIFEKFYRLPNTTERAKGSGLGLAITRSLVELHGGQISASSLPGEGTTFRFILPRRWRSGVTPEARDLPAVGVRADLVRTDLSGD